MGGFGGLRLFTLFTTPQNRIAQHNNEPGPQLFCTGARNVPPRLHLRVFCPRGTNTGYESLMASAVSNPAKPPVSSSTTAIKTELISQSAIGAMLQTLKPPMESLLFALTAFLLVPLLRRI